MTMITKRVNRYYCEFCKKAGCSGGHIRKHEERCTMNPDRVCMVCKKLLEQEQNSLDALKLLVQPKGMYCTEDDFSVTYKSDVLNESLVVISDAAGGCPACIAATYRQSGIPLPAVSMFDWKGRMQEIWARINERERLNDFSG